MKEADVKTALEVVRLRSGEVCASGNRVEVTFYKEITISLQKLAAIGELLNTDRVELRLDSVTWYGGEEETVLILSILDPS
jgi:hypothetical protein